MNFAAHFGDHREPKDVANGYDGKEGAIEELRPTEILLADRSQDRLQGGLIEEYHELTHVDGNDPG